MRYILAALALAITTAHAQEHAIIRPQHVLPPLQYDGPYKGLLTTVIAKDRAQVRAFCPRTAFPGHALACAYPRETECLIIMPTDAVLEAAGWTADIVLRHEIGHCNGWPAGHPNARRAD
jgi:hypothetical protein